MFKNKDFKAFSVWFNHQRCKPKEETNKEYLKRIINFDEEVGIELIDRFDFTCIFTLYTSPDKVDDSQEMFFHSSSVAPLWHDKMFRSKLEEVSNYSSEKIIEAISSFFETLMYKEKLVGCIDWNLDTGAVTTHFENYPQEYKDEEVDTFQLALDISEHLKNL